MAAYKVLIKRSAAKELDSISRKADRRRIVDRILALADDPRPPGCRKLSGSDRILYTIEDTRLIVHVIKIGDRRQVYRRK